MKKGIGIKQTDITDCGAACLASVAAHYQLYLPISRIRQHAGTDRHGTNVLGLIEAAERLNFQARAARGPASCLSKIPLPAIAHIRLANGLYHYVVIYRVGSAHITVMDPAKGRLCKEKNEDFLKKWTGVIVLLLPGSEFAKSNQMTSSFQRFWQLVKPHRSMMFQALMAAILYTALGLSASLYVQKIIDLVLPDANTKLLNLMGVVMIILLAFRLFSGYFKSLTGLQTGQFIDARLILGYYNHLLRLPQRFFDTMRTGEIISRINDAVKIRVFINDIAMDIAVNILIITFSMTVMFFYYWKLALVVLAIIPIYLFIYWLSNIVNKKWSRRLMENAAGLETQILESIRAVSTIKRFGLEEFSNFNTETRFIALRESIYKCSLKNLYIANACEFFTGLFTIVILWAGSSFVIEHELSPGELLSFYALIGYFTNPSFSLINANKHMQEALIAADRLFEIIDLETETEGERKLILTAEAVGDIRFNGVHFRYGTRVAVFHNLNLLIRRNTTTAIIGENGSGKSTLLSLLQNLYPPNKGNISIGDLDIKYISNKSLRQMVAVVPQRIDLFAGTIVENIAIGEYEPDHPRILQLAHLLGIHEFVEQLPEGYNTILNEQGIDLSGGQRQVLAIARALYRNPEILILDEATSSLDSAGQQKVQEALNWFKSQNKTVIIIAHRLSTIRNCDAIVVLKEGKVAEQGTHATLLARESHYRQLWNQHEGIVMI